MSDGMKNSDLAAIVAAPILTGLMQGASRAAADRVLLAAEIRLLVAFALDAARELIREARKEYP